MKRIEKSRKSLFASCWLFLAGLCMTGHFCYVAWRTIAAGTFGEILWITHIFTAIGGIGALAKNRKLVSAALVALFLNHAFWTADAVAWAFTGNFPFGFASYLLGQDAWAFLQSANHLFDLPLLFVSALLLKGVERRSWIWSGSISAILVIASRILVSRELNVNCAYAPWPGMDRLYPAFVLGFEGAAHVAVVIVVTVFFNHLPVNFCLFRLFEAINRKKAADKPQVPR